MTAGHEREAPAGLRDCTQRPTGAPLDRRAVV